MKVERHMKVSDGIYAPGDVTDHKQKIPIRAVQQASVVSSNLRSEVLGNPQLRGLARGEWVTLVPSGPDTGTGHMSQIVPSGFMVRLIKGVDYFVKWAHGIVYQ